MMRFEQKPDHTIIVTILFSMVGVFLADMVSPLGMAVWIIYLLPISLSLFLWRPVRVVILASIATLLLIVGYFVSSGEISPTIAAINRIFGFIIIWIVTAICYKLVSNKLMERRQEWLQTGQMQLSLAMSGELSVQALSDNILQFFAEYLNAQAGVLYVAEADSYRCSATYAVPHGYQVPEQVLPGQGLLGQAIKDLRTFVLNDIPEGYLKYGSSLGQALPRHLIVCPITADKIPMGVIELAFSHAVHEVDVDLIEQLAPSIGISIRSAKYLLRQQELLEETQQQSEELQAQSEELRVSNEELEEQTRALSETQSRLELQQAELEQTNSQLEEQTSLLEVQKADLQRSKASLENQAKELERASRYKSEFLANMSHELRTPLNSSLILAKLLADNREGNLTDEQIKFANTIHSAGNDLLTLINDILDLSKIESGRLEVRPELISIQSVIQNLSATFQPVASEKGIHFEISTTADLPVSIRTDFQRLEQILKNLLSNALKFTERGSVTLNISRAARGQVAFAVKDTGIGIADDQRDIIFEAFRQADGTTNRKYGGTGLGLSISRELARLLGGEIQLHSQAGQGSTFILTIPEKYEEQASETTSENNSAPPSPSGLTTNEWSLEKDEQAVRQELKKAIQAKPKPPVPPIRRSYLTDDREKLTGDRKIILAVEDDEPFAQILYNLAHEVGFQALLATSAEEGLALAAQFLPSAIILDIGLPDQLGLSVLDRLKHDVRTRHIPVHIVSASDYSEAALSLGAVGYMLKPVKREELITAFEGFKARFTQDLRRVLIVEDDAVQLDSLRRLLGSSDVNTIGVKSAADCLEQLKENTFDCMVLDLSLPDATGFSLLETLSREDRYSFPPVIVYTGRDLTSDEEQKLRRYSKSIIIKGARSPERLLDEVTLFLHQVVTELPAEQQEMLKKSQNREEILEGRRVLIVEDDVRNVFALTSVLEPRGILVKIARNGREALEMLEQTTDDPDQAVDLVLMDLMMPEMDGLTATREIRKRPEWAKLPIIALTAKAMKSDQQQCLEAGANDYMAKPLDVEKLLSLIRVWMRR